MVFLFVLLAMIFFARSLMQHPVRPPSCPVAFDLRERFPDVLRWVLSSFCLALAVQVAYHLSFRATAAAFLGFLIVTFVAMNMALRLMWRLLEGRDKRPK